MDYTQYKAEDFAADETFISYYLQADNRHVLFWTTWIAQHPHLQAETDEAVQLLNMVHIRLSSNEMQTERNRILGFLEEATPVTMPKARVFRINRAQIAIAATLLIICSVTVFLWLSKNKNKVTSHKLLTAYSVPGQQKVITLTDGSRVTLNGGSQLKYPAEFAGADRSISFEGEGLFEIAKDASHPFKVQTGKITTTVLGTTFNINTDKAVKVSLIEGKVRLTAPGNLTAILKPGEQGILLANKLSVQPFQAQEVQAWQSGSMVFKNASFNDVATQMYRVYGITLISSHPLKWNYTGSFERTNYRSVINSITYSKNLKYIVSHDTVTIK